MTIYKIEATQNLVPLPFPYTCAVYLYDGHNSLYKSKLMGIFPSWRAAWAAYPTAVLSVNG